MSEPVIELVTTVPNPDLGRDIGREAVKAGLAACAQVEGPVTSIYSWKGDLAEEREWRIRFKTFGDLASRLEEFIRARHPYAVPEIVVFPIRTVSASYLSWMEGVILP